MCVCVCVIFRAFCFLFSVLVRFSDKTNNSPCDDARAHVAESPSGWVSQISPLSFSERRQSGLEKTKLHLVVREEGGGGRYLSEQK